MVYKAKNEIRNSATKRTKIKHSKNVYLLVNDTRI